MRPRLSRHLLIAALAAALASAGCDRNQADPVLVPTGIRPSPETGAGAVSGLVVFDRAQAPDLATGPYPLTWVELRRDTALAARDTLAPTTRAFEFTGLGPGEYTVVAGANFFRRTSLPPVRVVSTPVDVGDLEISIDGADNPSDVHVIYDEATPPRTIPSGNARDTTGLMKSGPLGVWTFPQAFSRPPELGAGVHRIRFLLNRARANPVNWSTVSTDTLDAPFAFAPALRIEGAGTDFFTRVAAPTQFGITLDIRRRSITLNPLPVPAASRAEVRSSNP